MEGATVIVVAWQHEQRRLEGREKLAHLLVLGIAALSARSPETSNASG